MKKILLAGIIGGIIIFVWYGISWMLLPWHQTTVHKFKVDDAVAQAIEANAPVSGIYLLPSLYEKDMKDMTANKEAKHQPMVFSAVYLEGMPANMSQTMIISLITHIVSAFLVAWLLLQTHLKYFGRLGFVIIFALTAGIVSEVPMWTWFKFDPQYVLVAMGDLLVSWFLAGLVMAKICKR